ncbi:hypothetical protein B484DRAFT_392520 [Ochromonadaceae sp. CCMP2298]|nr:hypothetical protein B484DRAFT_392520 [Ochromonadaceae sp. CCMP2298]
MTAFCQSLLESRMFWDWKIMRLLMWIIQLVALVVLRVKALTIRGTSLIVRGTARADSTRKTVAVVGGGFGGLYSALKIARRADANTDVYLIDPKESFVFLPLLYELAVGTASAAEVAPTYESLFRGTRVKFLRAAVSAVDLDAHVCHLHPQTDAPKTLSYDKLVLAVGIQPRTELVAGAAEHSLPFYTADDAVKLKQRLAQLRDRQGAVHVAVIGGGYSGVEVATNVARDLWGTGENKGSKVADQSGEQGGEGRVCVTIVERNDALMPSSPAHNRNVALRSLKRCGVTTCLSTSVKAVEATGLRLEDARGERFLPADLVLFTAGTQQGALVRGLALPKDRQGRIRTSRTLQSETHDEVFALGDCAGGGDPATAQVAMQQAGVLANNVLRSIKADRSIAGTEGAGAADKAVGAGDGSRAVADSNGVKRAKHVSGLAEFKYFSLGEMLSLGDTDATVHSLGGWVRMSGLLAALARRAIYAVRMPTMRQRLRAFLYAVMATSRKLLLTHFRPRSASTPTPIVSAGSR